MKLYHVSDRPDLSIFVPREVPSSASGVTRHVVWAVDDDHLVNYLLPRECPRVAFYALPGSSADDITRFLNGVRDCHVVAIESAWFERATTSPLWIYEFSPQNFESIDPGAGYFVSTETETAIACQQVDNPFKAILNRRAEVRLVDSLWPLQEAVTKSSLQFSCIRMRNAQPRK